MRATCALLVAALVLGQAPLVRAAEPETESAEQLYEEGRKAYRLGRYDEAVKKFERSYELSDQPLLLYNIALSYKRLYGISKQTADLRRSKTVFEEFINVASADTALTAEVEDARARLAEIDDEIAKAEKADAARQRPTTNGSPPADQGPSARDRKLRIAGAATMGAGGAMLVAGVIVGSVYVVYARGYREDVKSEKDQIDDPLCETSNPPPGCPASRVARLRFFRDKLDASNLGTALGYGLGAGLGLAAIVAGAVVFAKGSRRKRAATSAQRLQISPTLGGAVISGRF
jgi:tetratricopeptide (TPR) repeat protein